jgi:plastocyanin
MKLGRSVLTLAALSVLLAGSSLLGCSKSTSPTNPYGGGSTGDGTNSGNAAFNSGTLNAPATFVHAFPNAGTVGYHCIFHVSMGMTGTVTVVSGAADSAVVTASGMSFAPAAVSIKPGGFVRWNVTAGTHTVTSN